MILLNLLLRKISVKLSIYNASQEVVNLEITIGELKESPFVLSEHVYEPKSALFMLRCILQSSRLAIARERIENSRQMTLFNFMWKSNQSEKYSYKNADLTKMWT